MRPRSDTKRRLLETALEMIWESSYASVSVDDICHRAKVNKGSFYHAYKSKSALAVAAYEHHWDLKRPQFDAIFSSQVSPLKRIENYCKITNDEQTRKFHTFGKMLGCPYSSVGAELSTQDENIRGKVSIIAHRIEKYLESAVRDLAVEGSIDSADHGELAEVIYAYITGVLTQSKIENRPMCFERMKSGINRILKVKV
jgi:TetR/AcrR family transcriptional repressor of nem operon